MEEDLTPPLLPPGPTPQAQISRDLRVLQRKDIPAVPSITLAGLMQESLAIRTGAESRPRSSQGRQKQQGTTPGGARAGGSAASKENAGQEKAPKRKRLSLKKTSKQGKEEDDDDTGVPVAKRPTAPGKAAHPVLPALTAEMFQGLER